MKTVIIIFLILSINICAFAQTDNPKIVNDSLREMLSYEALSDHELDMKIGGLISDAGRKQKTAFLTGVIGAGASIILGAVTYDKKDKTISPIAFLPVFIGGIVAIINVLTGFNDLDNAGKLMQYKATRNKK